MIIVECHDCLRRFQVGDELGGKVVSCMCGKPLKVRTPKAKPVSETQSGSGLIDHLAPVKGSSKATREPTHSVVEQVTPKSLPEMRVVVEQAPLAQTTVVKTNPGCLVQGAALMVIIVFGGILLIVIGPCIGGFALLGLGASVQAEAEAQRQKTIISQCQSCKKAGRNEEEILETVEDYQHLKDGGKTKAEVRLISFESCNRAADTSLEMETCHACVDEMLAQVFP
jgi:hypothetical protein